ncbi:MAG: sigma-54-dependent Fis family transcriptional regulator [Bacteroidales bacterium]|nr:sigma-54-dependent Fis family transcriptional regulator [Bacteroidales bacterium]
MERSRLKSGSTSGSPEEMLSVLILDDDLYFTEELTEFFQHKGFLAFQANTGEAGIKILQDNKIDLLILDVRLPGISGLDILKEVREVYPDLEVIIISAHGDMETVIRAMRLGAFDYLKKPFRHVDIQIAIERTEKFLRLTRKLSQIELKNSLISRTLEERIERNLIGVSRQIREVLDLAMQAAKFRDTSVLITGESGTGKENMARIIHYASDRKDEILYSVNSGSITESLYESEFFGHKKGAFTGADSDKKGYFEICNNGTLFLDEIADMPLPLQAKMLRVLEEKKVTRVGDIHPVFTDFRLITASNHDLDALVEEKSFRLDLLHRLNTLTIHIPPLRERPEDIEPLLVYFIDLFSKRINSPTPKIDPNVFHALQSYYFPGNVRELKNMAERAVILYKGGLLGIQNFPLKTTYDEMKEPPCIISTLQETEIDLIRKAFQRCGFNQKATAEMLGISRDALIRKLKKYNITIQREINPS